MCLAQGQNTAVTPVGIEPRNSRFGVRRSTTTPPRSLDDSKRTYLEITCVPWFVVSVTTKQTRYVLILTDRLERRLYLAAGILCLFLTCASEKERLPVCRGSWCV